MLIEAEEGGHTFRLQLPEDKDSPGTIRVTGSDGKELLAERPLPDGIMPHGPKGVKMLDRWDSTYRRKGPAPWDTGKPSSELRKVVSEKTITPCRAVEFGCGTGTNAIYLAKQGFDVTAIDVAPTCLMIARRKAEKAGVKVRWVLASVLAPPDLGKFDFMFDRGCYHGVRRADPKGFVKSLAGLTKIGARVLILAGNAKEKKRGPPRVTEETVRNDFSKQFDFVWLKDTRFDTRKEDKKGPLAWTILMKRK
jgi:SAM-dependent methyltransferase